MKKIQALLLLSVVALSLAACGGEPDDGDGETSYVDITDQQGGVEGFVGASDDAVTERCESGGDGWVSAGTVTNLTDDEQSYRLYVAFNDNRDTRGLVQIDIESVPAGATESWETTAPIRGEDLSCVLRVERFDPQG